MLRIEELSVRTKGKLVLERLNLEIHPGEMHALVGPNGAGKSTLSSVLSGRKEYVVVSGRMIFDGLDLLQLTPEERARHGIFTTFQHPIDVPGVTYQVLLRTSLNIIRKHRRRPTLDRFAFKKYVRKRIESLKLSSDILHRFINVGFSGGEKKKNDILQMMVLKPKLCILDESDSGLDMDSLEVVLRGIRSLSNRRRSFIVITHSLQTLRRIQLHRIHVLYRGKIVRSGGLSLVDKIEKEGYAWASQNTQQ